MAIPYVDTHDFWCVQDFPERPQQCSVHSHQLEKKEHFFLYYYVRKTDSRLLEGLINCTVEVSRLLQKIRQDMLLPAGVADRFREHTCMHIALQQQGNGKC
jgi:hypothetical protein